MLERWRKSAQEPPRTPPGEWYERSGAAQFGLSRFEFEAALRRVEERYLSPVGSGKEEAAAREQFRSRLHLEELALAQACAAGHEGAWELFWQRYRRPLQQMARTLVRDGQQARELAESLLAELFGLEEKDGVRQSKLSAYHGVGSLLGWLRATLAQRATDAWRAQKRLVSLEDPDGGDVLEAALRRRRAPEPEPAAAPPSLLEEGLRAVLAELSGEERLLLALYFLDGVSLAEIGAMLSIHESTVSRRLEKLLGQARKQLQRQLLRRGLSLAAVREALGSDVRQLDLDVVASLRPAAGKKSASSPARPVPPEGGRVAPAAGPEEWL